MLNYTRKLYSYNEWANREAFASLERMDIIPAKGLGYFAHILAAEQLWHTRLMRQSTRGLLVWPEWTRQECEEQLPRTAELWQSYLVNLTAVMLPHTFSYTNTKGEAWQGTIMDVLTHVIIHSGYHRGQIAAEVRRAGGEPAYTDFIHALRSGFVGT